MEPARNRCCVHLKKEINYRCCGKKNCMLFFFWLDEHFAQKKEAQNVEEKRKTWINKMEIK
jgi:hypothetical protein